MRLLLVAQGDVWMLLQKVVERAVPDFCTPISIKSNFSIFLRFDVNIKRKQPTESSNIEGVSSRAQAKEPSSAD
jgi:hypothetical protein